jgi:hypothetical protein
LILIVYGVLVVCVASLAAVAGLTLVQRLVPSLRRQHRSKDAAVAIYQTLGVVYAVLLGLVVIAVWEEYGTAAETVESEANAVAEIAWLAHGLPEPDGLQLQELARSYTQEVVEEEWPQMEQGRVGQRGWDLIDDVRVALQEVEPRTEPEQALYAEGQDQVQRLADARRMRLVAAEERTPAVLWVVLILGGVATIGFTYLFGLEATWANRLMVATLAVVISLALFTVGVLEHPFSGGARVEPGAYELILDRFETSKLSDL